MYNVIKSGSEGNAVIYNNNILVDCGVPFASLKPFVYSLKLVFISHLHSDHFNIKTIEKLSKERPTIRFACSEFIAEKLSFVKNLDVLKTGIWYDYINFKVALFELYHDISNFGIRININGYKIIHATDTAHLEGIEARGYNLYSIEHNYDADTINDKIKEIESKGGYSHHRGAVNSHLSEQQAREFIHRNAGENYEVLRLHESKH
jgi:L-ascorbate metabolism protein UlaG (beta-lactamase superfamily)